MATKFLFRSSSWLACTQRLSRLKTNILYSATFQKSAMTKRSFVTANSVDFDHKLNRLVIKWNDDLVDEYPVVWLRDNCQCPACFDQLSQSRNTDFSKFQLDSKPKNSVIEEGNVEVQWKDGHKSVYDFNWLKSRSFRQNEQQNWLDSQKAPYKTWTANEFKTFPIFDFQLVMKDDVALLEWLQILDVWGVSRMKNVPISLGQAGNLANRVAFMRRTHYGEELDIKVKPNHNNLADTGTYFQLHTDLPYYEYMPGINLLYCYTQYSGVGGDSFIADGFQVAEWLRKNDPEAYKCLTETEVTWSDVGQEKGTPFHTINHGPVICESHDKKVRRINYNHPTRDSHFVVPIDVVENWYCALKKFYGLALDPSNFVEFKLQPGQLLAFDNLRVLHGRTSFKDTVGAERHVQVAYVDWDEARSKIRVLKNKLSLDKN